jgi:hypothetical protein
MFYNSYCRWINRENREYVLVVRKNLDFIAPYITASTEINYLIPVYVILGISAKLALTNMV